MSFVATYHGTCAECGETIAIGQRIEPASEDTWGRAWSHVDCAAMPEKAACVCAACWTVHVGECI